MSGFDEGAKAMFDHFAMRAANNFHGDPVTDAVCQKENELIMELAEEALDHVSPKTCAHWRKITELRAQIARLTNTPDKE